MYYIYYITCLLLYRKHFLPKQISFQITCSPSVDHNGLICDAKTLLSLWMRASAKCCGIKFSKAKCLKIYIKSAFDTDWFWSELWGFRMTHQIDACSFKSSTSRMELINSEVFTAIYFLCMPLREGAWSNSLTKLPGSHNSDLYWFNL